MGPMTPIERLRSVDAGTVSDACDQLGLHRQVSTATSPLTGAVRIAGRAITVELGPPSAEPGGRHVGAWATDTVAPDDIIVVAHQGRTDCAGWGGILARAASERGAVGTVVDGAVRDVDEAIQLGYPVFATATTARSGRGRAVEKAWGSVIDFDGVTVATGDYVVADTSGVVFIPASEIERVLDVADIVGAKEASLIASLVAGVPVREIMRLDDEAMVRPDPSDQS